jgi:hypothetical protein
MIVAKSYRVISLIAGAGVLLSGVTASVTANVVNQGNSVLTGSQGPIGATGSQGPVGPIGSSGATGSQGPVGPTGSSGATGSQGPVGSSGPTGETGAQGPVGPTGPVGPAGADGREVEFRTNNNVLEWRYVGEQTWNQLNLNFGSNVVTSGSSTDFSNWIFNEDFNFNFTASVNTPITDQAAYVTALRANPNYVEITNVTDLLSISSNTANLSKNYFLSSDIDLTTYSADPNNINKTYLIGDGIYHDPFQTSPDISFTGIFDGAGYEIKNYTMTADTRRANFGVFQETKGAIIKNLDLKNFVVDFTAQNTHAFHIGGLIGRTVEDNSETTVIQNVHLDGFTLSNSHAEIYNVGGLIGDASSGTSILNSSVKNVTVQSDYKMNRIGGLIGENDVRSKKGIVNSTTVQNVIIGRKDMTMSPSVTDFNRFGGMFGEVEGAIEIINSTASLVSNYFSKQVGGIAGDMEDIKGFIEDVTVTINVDHPTNDGYAVGGVAGRLGSDVLLFINDVVTNGVIKTEFNAGGLFGWVEYYDNALKITNTINNVDLHVNDNVGGVVGMVEGWRNFFHIQNFTNNGDFYPFLKNSGGFSTLDVSRVGGVFGLVDDGDDWGENDVNEIVIENTIINSDFIYVINDLSPWVVNNNTNYNFNFEEIGGLIGEVDDTNRIRVINTTITSDFMFEVKDATQTMVNASFDLDVYSIGGVIGYLYESTLDLINVTYQGEISLLADDLMFNNQLDNAYYLNIGLGGVGGAVGYVENDDNRNIVIVAGHYDLDVDVDFLSVAYTQGSTGHTIDFEIDDVGGLIGEYDTDEGEILRLQNVIVTLGINVLVEPQIPLTGKTFVLDIYQVGGLIGDSNGIILEQNTVVTFVRSFTIPSVINDPNTNLPATITDQWNNIYFVTDFNIYDIEDIIGYNSGLILSIA